MNSQNPQPADKQKLLNLTVAGVASQVGCLTIVIILGALFLGMYLDKLNATRPWYTIGFVIGSIPLSLIVMIVIVLAAVKKIKPAAKNPVQQEEKDLGK
jgi:F0F1-type ATP synthase assembly protein I